MISIYTHQKNAFMCMFMFSSFSILLLLTATSWPGDIGCCGNGGNRDREGREGAFSLFCGVLGKDRRFFFPSVCLSRRDPNGIMQWAHLEQIQGVIVLLIFWP